MGNYALTVENLSKRYRILKSDGLANKPRNLLDFLKLPYRRFQEIRGLTSFGSSENNVFWALKDINFNVKHGEVLGIIGRNGTGKSTLLKILSKITTPTTGRIEINGRVNSLLEVGTGFNPELTGRENIYMNGTIHGMSKKEIDSKLDEIIDFAGVEKFINMPIKRYSSGMNVRLGFAVAAHLQPEILLVDEVLAVGDVEFQKKCLGKMEDVSKEGRTVLFVSHNMPSITRLCSKTFVLDSGTYGFLGNTKDAVSYYLQSGAKVFQSSADLRDAPGWEPNRRVIFTAVSTHRLDGIETFEFFTGEGILIKIRYQLDEPIQNAYYQVNFLDFLGERVMTVSNMHGGEPIALTGEGVIECRLDTLRLVSGEYTLDIEIGRRFPCIEYLDYVPSAARIRIELKDYLRGNELVRGQGVIAQKSHWSIISQ